MPRLASRRRLVLPFLILVKLVRARRAGARYDVIEIHEPLAGPYALVGRLAAGRLPSCVVLSFGLEEQGWKARVEHLRAHGRAPSVATRVLVPMTLFPRMRLGLCNAQAVLVSASTDRDYLIHALGRTPETVSCCFTGVSEEFFGVERTEHKGLRLLFLGSWIGRKGTAELRAAWQRLAAERDDVSLTVAGVRDGVRARADLAGVPRVKVIDSVARADLPALLAEHDVFVLPSWFEGMPLSMLEAAAAGLPCVVSAVSGNLDVFRPEDPQRDGGVLVPHSDADALRRGVLAVIDDEQLRLTLGARARERARGFTWATCADQALAAYAVAVERRSARSPG